MSIEESQVLLNTMGTMEAPQQYIYIQPTIMATGEREYELKIHAGIGDILNSIFLLWEALRRESKELSDQDLYDLCKDFDIDFNLFKEQMRGDTNA